MPHYLWNNLFKKDKQKELKNILKEVPLFQSLSCKELGLLIKIMHLRNFSKEEIVFKEKEPGAGMYIIISGQIKIFYKSLLGKEEELTLLDKGDFFGELALLDESPRSATAKAVENTELLSFFRADLIELIKKQPVLASKILFELAKITGIRLREANKDLKKV
jgi:CRP-like cAMP-binding protein